MQQHKEKKSLKIQRKNVSKNEVSLKNINQIINNIEFTVSKDEIEGKSGATLNQ